MSKLSISLSAKRKHIVINQKSFDEDGFERQNESRTGILAIDPSKDPDQMLTKAQAIDWNLVGEPDAQTGFYKVVKADSVEVSSEEELEQEA